MTWNTTAIAHLAPGKISILVPISEEWKADYTLVRQSGQVVISEIRVLPFREVPEGGLTSAILRQVRAGERVRFAEVLSHHLSIVDLSDGFREELSKMLDALTPPKKPLSKRGRKRTPDLELAKLARDYVRLTMKSARPIIDVAKKHSISKSQARARIYQARERGILQSVRVRGRAGGQLTEEAEELIRKAETSRSQRKK